MKTVYLAIDIGASSGRHIAGWTEDGGLRTEEVYRFPNGPAEAGGHLTWDTEALLFHVKEGIRKAKERFGRIASLSIDTWGVDYVLLDGDREIGPCFSYRDGRTADAVKSVHGILPFPSLYRRTGIQFQLFNTLYQLVADKTAGRLSSATDFLQIPAYLMYRLTGVKCHEYTNATTTGLVNAGTGAYDREIIEALGLPERLFHPLLMPGTCIGEYEGIRVVLCATHDTGSAVEGIPMDGNEPYISSGTWSLLGIRTERPLTDERSECGNWSNEGGVGYNRYQKNIMGMWIVNRLREELCPEEPFSRIVAEAEESGFDGIVDANGAAFLSPHSMKTAFDEALLRKPASAGDYFRCAFRSLAASYAESLRELRENTGIGFGRVTIVGGGAKNGYLNRLTGEMSGKEIVALPIEATALGNLKIQMEADRS